MTSVTVGWITAAILIAVAGWAGWEARRRFELRRASQPRTFPPRPAPAVPQPAWGMPQFPAQHAAPQVARTQERHLQPPSIPAEAYTGRHHLEVVNTTAIPTVKPTPGKEWTS